MISGSRPTADDRGDPIPITAELVQNDLWDNEIDQLIGAKIEENVEVL